MEEKENLKELLSKAYEMKEDLQKDCRLVLIMGIISIISLIIGIIKLDNNIWIWPLILVLFGCSLTFGYMLVSGLRLLKRTMAVIIALEYKIDQKKNTDDN